jgi:signal transduction histidine kinase
VGWSERNTGTIVVAVVASTVFVAVAVLFANVTASSRVAGNAQDLHWANATLGTAALARVAAGQVVIFTELADGDLDATPVEVATAELAGSTSSLRRLAAQAPADFQGDLEPLIGLLEGRPLDIDAIDAAYRAMVVPLGAHMDALEASIRDSEAAAQLLSGAIRLLVTLILPVLAILLYRRRAAAQVRAAQIEMDAQLAADRRIAKAKNQFVAGMSHEMRTPLTGIYGFSEVLLDSPPEAEMDRELITVINTEAAELSRMVDDFIAFSHIDSKGLEAELAPTDLSTCVETVIDRFRRRGTEITVDGDADGALADPRLTEQILTNFVSNAIQHGGETIRIVLHSSATMVRCDVIDDGPGVDQAMIDRLFTRFVHDGAQVFTTGTPGLGLWVARHLARAMGGDVSYERREGLTVFSLHLPKAHLGSAEMGPVSIAAAS